MHVLVIGASGRVGQRFCVAALAAGHRVRGFSRSVKAQGVLAGIEAVQGDVLDRDALLGALDGVDVVVSSMGMDRGSDFPWARIKVPTDIHSTTAGALVGGMQERGMKRLVLVSAHGVGDSWGRVAFPVRALIASSSIGVAYKDLARAENVLRTSDIEWTAVRPTVLSDAVGTGRWRADANLKTGLSAARIPRDDVAAFLLHVVESGAHVRQAVSVTGAS
ncbi:MAG: NAD(P)-dependent oxidoreductase [Myxococcota bacterium]